MFIIVYCLLQFYPELLFHFLSFSYANFVFSLSYHADIAANFFSECVQLVYLGEVTCESPFKLFT